MFIRCVSNISNLFYTIIGHYKKNRKVVNRAPILHIPLPQRVFWFFFLYATNIPRVSRSATSIQPKYQLKWLI
ncbi:hypothetical protein XENTR_v10009063 [Xenopus tropicalis]|nr:hypothetical protein XENTR_v10009063 [Xenopus tropicalis]